MAIVIVTRVILDWGWSIKTVPPCKEAALRTSVKPNPRPCSPFSMDAYGVLTEVEQTEKSLVVSLKSPAVYFSTLSQYALDVEKDLILQSGDVGVLISVDALRLQRTNRRRHHR